MTPVSKRLAAAYMYHMQTRPDGSQIQSFSAPQSLLAALQAEAKRRDVSQSTVIRAALEAELERANH